MRNDPTKNRTAQQKSADPAPLPEREFERLTGRLQRLESLCMAAAAAGGIGCAAVLLIARAPLPAAALFALAAAAVLLGSGAQKKKKALIRGQMAESFRAEREALFGSEPLTPELPIDEARLRAARLTGRDWETCRIWDFHEGVYRGVRFSAANAALEHVYRRFQPHDGAQTCTQTILRGIVLCCKTAQKAPTRVCVRRRSAGEDTGVVDVDPERLFTADTGACAEARALLTPQLLAALKSFEKNLGGTVAGLAWDASTLLLAVDTAYVFADVPDIPDARKPEALRQQYAASLAGMQHALDALFDSSGLFCPE